MVRLRHRATMLAAVLAGIGFLFALLNRSLTLVNGTEPYDLDVNLVAARRLLDGRSLYDADASRMEGVRHVAAILRYGYHNTFDGFVGAPVVALLHAPFAEMGHGEAVAAFRVVNLLCLLGAVAVLVLTLPRANRRIGLLVAFGALTLSYPLITTFELGQFHGLVLLGLALGAWGVANDRWTVAGVGLGLAAVIKLSPVLLIVYLCIRGSRRVLLPALITMATMTVMAMSVGRPAAILEWLQDVVPKLSEGTRFLRNQSGPALVERTITSGDALSETPLGPVRVLAPLLVISGCFLLWWLCRRRATVAPLELGAVTLVLLLAGPVSWDHYFVWSVVPLVLFCDVRLWVALPSRLRVKGVVMGGLALLLFSLPAREQRVDGLTGGWGRQGGSPYAVAALLLLVLAGILLAPDPGNETDEHPFDPLEARVE